VGSNITISGAINPLRPNVPVTIYTNTYTGWNTLATVKTDSNSHYSYTWTPEENGTYQFMAMWEGDNNTFGDVSGVLTLTVPTCVFVFVFEVEGFQVIMQTNSTISAFNFSQPLNQISFNVTGPTGTAGFCNVAIPNDLLSGEFSVQKDGSLLVKDVDYTQTYNGTHYIFYITYTHTTHVIEIRGTEVIPEITTWTSILLILILLTIAIAFYKRRLLKTPIH
jgi:hypothetical protein